MKILLNATAIVKNPSLYESVINLIKEDVVGFVVESDASLHRRSVELGDLVAEIIQADTEQNLVVEEFMLLTKHRPDEFIQEHVCVLEVFREVPADDRVVREEVKGYLCPLGLQSLRHVTKTRADLDL